MTTRSTPYNPIAEGYRRVPGCLVLRLIEAPANPEANEERKKRRESRGLRGLYAKIVSEPCADLARLFRYSNGAIPQRRESWHDKPRLTGHRSFDNRRRVINARQHSNDIGSHGIVTSGRHTIVRHEFHALYRIGNWIRWTLQIRGGLVTGPL